MPKKKISAENAKRLEYLSTYLKEYRINSGLTQDFLGMLSKHHRNSIIRCEGGENITLRTLFELADALDISLSDLFQDIDE